jgi:hypothetical protein
LEWVKCTKGKVVCQEEKSQDTGGFLKPFGENLTGRFCSVIREAKDRGAILASRHKGGLFTHYSKMPKAWHRESEEGDCEGEKRSPIILDASSYS